MEFLEILKVILLGIVEGITEWLPVSSTGHMLLLDELVTLRASEAFKEMFFVVIQLGAILAVVVLFWHKLFPWHKERTESTDGQLQKGKIVTDKNILSLWGKVLVACVPAGVIGILFDDLLEKYLHTPLVIALTLIIYGVAFILIENRNKTKDLPLKTTADITYKHALIIGAFQVLSLIPGTSRSGSTILGGMLTGVSRTASAEFSFFMAIPVMLGASGLKLLKFIIEGFTASSTEIVLLLVGIVVSFAVSLFVIKFLMDFVKRHDFSAFGIYRIVLGVLVLLYFLIKI